MTADAVKSRRSGWVKSRSASSARAMPVMMRQLTETAPRTRPSAKGRPNIIALLLFRRATRPHCVGRIRIRITQDELPTVPPGETETGARGAEDRTQQQAVPAAGFDLADPVAESSAGQDVGRMVLPQLHPGPADGGSAEVPEWRLAGIIFAQVAGQGKRG